MNRSIESIMTWLTEQVQSKQIISPQQYVEAAAYLNILKGEEDSKLIQLKSDVAKMRQDLLPRSKSVAEVKLIIEASDKYREMKLQEAYLERIEETIKISKLYARLKNDEVKHY